MPKIICKYFSTVYGIINKNEEALDVPAGTTVEGVLELLVQKYGGRLEEHLYSEGTICGKYYKTASVYVNKKRIQWVQDFPEGIQTRVKNGDELSLGLIMGGG
jgi:hypothetical protein